MAETTFDVVIIGGGPGGYVAAIRASQLGLQAALVEREHLGGVCLNWGCIPTKTLLHTADLYREMQQAERFGLTAEASFDIDKVVSRSRAVAGQLNSGVKFLMRKHKVEVFEGAARLTGGGGVAVGAGRRDRGRAGRRQHHPGDGRASALTARSGAGRRAGVDLQGGDGPDRDAGLAAGHRLGGDRRGVRQLLPGAGGGGDGGGGAAPHSARGGRRDLSVRAGGVREAGHHDSHQRDGGVPREGAGQRNGDDRNRGRRDRSHLRPRDPGRGRDRQRRGAGPGGDGGGCRPRGDRGERVAGGRTSPGCTPSGTWRGRRCWRTRRCTRA